MEKLQLASIRLETLKLAIQVLINTGNAFNYKDVLTVASELEKFIQK